MKIRQILCVLIAVTLLICTVQATTLAITVVDEEDNSAIEDASIYIDGDYEGKTDEEGEFSYKHSLDDSFRLEVMKSGYEDWSKRIDEDDTSVEVELTKETATLEIYVYDADSVKPINDVEVEVTAEDSGESDSDETDSSGAVEFDLEADEYYELVITKNDYVTLTKTFEMDSGDMVLSFWLVHENRYIFSIQDSQNEPLAGASVYVDGDLEGTTGGNGYVSADLEKGESYQIRVEKEGYSTYSEYLKIGSGELLRTIELSLSTYPLRLLVVDSMGEPLSGADVFLDEAQEGETGLSGEFSLESVVEGTYEIRIEKEGYISWEDTREIGGNADITVELDYIKIPVTVRVEDEDHTVVPGALVLLDGEDLGITDTKGEVKKDLDPASSYNFTATKSGYKSASVVRPISMGISATTVPLTLEKDLDVGFIVMVVLGAAGIIVVVMGIRWYMTKRSPPSRRLKEF